MRQLWYVTKTTLGADRKSNFYFETKQEAQIFADMYEYTSNVRKTRNMSEDDAREYLESTKLAIDIINYIY